ncbi:hypothetical protein HMPREF9261_1775 [Finegoldia magna ACS-171-V-Col3]|nr:hypothetical protein HMPREF9261_1775 [Finegoldia magna ACS-171-V-Col3]
MIRLFTMFLVYFNAFLAKNRKTFTLYRDMQNKKSRSTFVWLPKIGKF